MNYTLFDMNDTLFLWHFITFQVIINSHETTGGRDL